MKCVWFFWSAGSRCHSGRGQRVTPAGRSQSRGFYSGVFLKIDRQKKSVGEVGGVRRRPTQISLYFLVNNSSRISLRNLATPPAKNNPPAEDVDKVKFETMMPPLHSQVRRECKSHLICPRPQGVRGVVGASLHPLYSDGNFPFGKEKGVSTSTKTSARETSPTFQLGLVHTYVGVFKGSSSSGKNIFFREHQREDFQKTLLSVYFGLDVIFCALQQIV